MLAAYEAAAVRAARQAGALIRDRLGTISRYQTKSGAHDLVTEVDRAAEALILAELRAAFPDVPALGEEGGGAGPEMGGHDLLWLVDPLDGTMNFVHGLPGSTVSIALARRGDLAVGVVYDPQRDELFTARAGAGACLNGAPVQVHSCQDLGKALLSTGLSTDLDHRRTNVEGFSALSPHVRNIRILGSAALHLAYTACGRLSGFWEIALQPWDMAAGALLVREAGGLVTDTLGRPYALGTRHVVATCGPIHRDMLAILRAAGATG